MPNLHAISYHNKSDPTESIVIYYSTKCHKMCVFCSKFLVCANTSFATLEHNVSDTANGREISNVLAVQLKDSTSTPITDLSLGN